MINLELTEQEAAVLGDVLASYNAELHTEIAHTDGREFRSSLKEREALIKNLLDRLSKVQNRS